jgi:hypothetical protein
MDSVFSFGLTTSHDVSPEIVDGYAYPKLELYFDHSFEEFGTSSVIIGSCFNPLTRVGW